MVSHQYWTVVITVALEYKQYFNMLDCVLFGSLIQKKNFQVAH